MNALGLRHAAAFGAESDVREWSARVALNPARIPSGADRSAAVEDAVARIGEHADAAAARLSELAAAG